MGNTLITVDVYECERYFNQEIQQLKKIINKDKYNNFCDEFETLHYLTKLNDILTNIEKSNYCIKEKLMRMNVIIRYLNCSMLLRQYMNKSIAQNCCEKYINNKIPNRLQTYRYSSFKATECYNWLLVISCCWCEEEFF